MTCSYDIMSPADSLYILYNIGSGGFVSFFII